MGVRVERFAGLIGEIVRRAGVGEAVLGGLARERLLAGARRARAGRRAGPASCARWRAVRRTARPAGHARRAGQGARAWPRPTARRARARLGGLTCATTPSCERLGRLDSEQRAVRALDALRERPALWGARPSSSTASTTSRGCSSTRSRRSPGRRRAVTVSLAYEPGRTAFAGARRDLPGARSAGRRAPPAASRAPSTTRRRRAPRSPPRALAVRARRRARRLRRRPVRLLEGGGERAELELVARRDRAAARGGWPPRTSPCSCARPARARAAERGLRRRPRSRSRCSGAGRSPTRRSAARCRPAALRPAAAATRPATLERSARVAARARPARAAPAGRSAGAARAPRRRAERRAARALWEERHWRAGAIDRVREAQDAAPARAARAPAPSCTGCSAPRGAAGERARARRSWTKRARSPARAGRSRELRELAPAPPSRSRDAPRARRGAGRPRVSRRRRPGAGRGRRARPAGAARPARARAVRLRPAGGRVPGARARRAAARPRRSASGWPKRPGCASAAPRTLLAAERYLFYAAVSRPRSARAELAQCRRRRPERVALAVRRRRLRPVRASLLAARERRALGAVDRLPARSPTAPPARRGASGARPARRCATSACCASCARATWSASAIELWSAARCTGSSSGCSPGGLEPDPEPLARGGARATRA